jgi:two-component system response regulator FixJ
MLAHLASPWPFAAPAFPRLALAHGSPASGTSAPVAVPGKTDSAVYIVESDRSLRIGLTRDLTAARFAARPFSTAEDFAAALPELSPGCVLADIAVAHRETEARRDDAGAGALRFPTILLFSALDEQDAVAAVRLGAADLLRRPVPLDALIAALRRAAPKVRQLEMRRAAERAKATVDTLTPRQRQVMECMMLGLSNKDMARTLGISFRTVEMHRARLQHRLSLTSLTELLTLAWSARGADADWSKPER